MILIRKPSADTGGFSPWPPPLPLYFPQLHPVALTGGTTLYTPAEYTSIFAASGEQKAKRPVWQILALAFLAGFLIAMSGVVANTAAHAIGNEGLARMVSGLLFPFGLIMVVLTGAELFTGDTLMALTLKERKITLIRMIVHWLLVFAGNAAGAISVAFGCAYFGQLNYSNGQLAVYSINQAVSKSTMDPLNAFVLGILCNILVTIAVLLALGAKDATGRSVSAYMPIAFFVIAGFEHSIANLYYAPAGLFASTIDRYANLAREAGIDVTDATWGGFLLHNLLPVTLGNTVGGLFVGWLFFWCHLHWNRVNTADADRA